MSNKLCFTGMILAAAVAIITAQQRFRLQNAEMNSFKIDLDSDGGSTLVSRRHADGVTFTIEATTGRLKTTDGLCVHTGPYDTLQLEPCDEAGAAEEWHYYATGNFQGFATGPDHEYMACWRTGTGWQGAQDADGQPLIKEEFEASEPALGCVWSKVPA